MISIETQLIASRINKGLSSTKQEYALHLYDAMLHEAAKRTSDVEDYAKIVLPVARYVVEKTDLPVDRLAKKLDTFVRSHVTDIKDDFSLVINEGVNAKYDTELKTKESKLAVLACEFVDREL